MHPRVVIVGSLMAASLPAGQLGLVGAVAAAAAQGSVTKELVPGKQYLLLTDRRLVFFAMNQSTGRPVGQINAERPPSALTAGPTKRGLLLTTVDISVAGSDRRMRPRFPLPARADAYKIAQSLGGSSAGPSSA